MDNSLAHGGDHASASLVRRPNALSRALFGGAFTVRHLRNGLPIWESGSMPNLIVTEGLNALRDKWFLFTGSIAAWYVGLAKTGSTFAAGDTLASHAGWTEAVVSTDYTGNRKTWTGAAGSTGAATNSAAVASFAMLGSLTITGCFLTSVASGTGGTLYSAVAFTGGSRSVVNGDTLEVTYNHSFADDGV